MPEYQAMGECGVIDRVLAPDNDTARVLFMQKITKARYPYLYGLWKANAFTVRESKNPRMAGTIQGQGETEHLSITS